MSTDVKLVPDTEPNADGYWLTVYEVTPPIEAKWAEGVALLLPYIPKGFHIVQYTADYHALWTRDRFAGLEI